MSSGRRTGIEDHWALVGGRRLRFGYTTGTCAAAAAKAAALMLLTGREPASVEISTPKGIDLDLPVESAALSQGRASCAVRKFAGDDPDVTDGILVFAEVSRREDGAVVIDGGEGVGRITRQGLQRDVGEAAINNAPRAMIEREVRSAAEAAGADGGFDVVISIPEGAEIASRTFNPQLGITGGISVLGTSGIVEPMSEAAFVETIRIEASQRRELGCGRLVLTPGNYGADLLHGLISPDLQGVKCGNLIGRALDIAADLGFKEILFAAHIGKMIKIAGGIMNTYSREADGRAEVMAACALRAGAPAEVCARVLDCITTDEMLDALREAGYEERAVGIAADRAHAHIARRAGGAEAATIMFTGRDRVLSMRGPAEEWISQMRGA